MSPPLLNADRDMVWWLPIVASVAKVRVIFTKLDSWTRLRMRVIDDSW